MQATTRRGIEVGERERERGRGREGGAGDGRGGGVTSRVSAPPFKYCLLHMCECVQDDDDGLTMMV